MRGHLVVGLMMLLAVAACAPRTRNGDRDGNPLLASLQATTLGDSVRFVLQVTNTSESPVELEFRSGQAFDFVVLEGEREVWRWSAEQMFTQALRSETLEAGETRSYEASWTPAAGRTGEHVVVGRLTAASHPLEQRTRFRIP